MEAAHLAVLETGNLLELHLELAHELGLVRVVPVAPVAVGILRLLLEELLEALVVEVLRRRERTRTRGRRARQAASSEVSKRVMKTVGSSGDARTEAMRSWSSRRRPALAADLAQRSGAGGSSRRQRGTHVDLPLRVERALDPLAKLLRAEIDDGGGSDEGEGLDEHRAGDKQSRGRAVVEARQAARDCASAGRTSERRGAGVASGEGRQTARGSVLEAGERGGAEEGSSDDRTGGAAGEKGRARGGEREVMVVQPRVAREETGRAQADHELALQQRLEAGLTMVGCGSVLEQE